MLKPNPNYHGPRPQRLDAIVYRTGIDVGRAARWSRRERPTTSQEVDPALAPTTAAARAAGAALPPDAEQLDRAPRAQHAQAALRRRPTAPCRRVRPRPPRPRPSLDRRHRSRDEPPAPAQHTGLPRRRGPFVEPGSPLGRSLTGGRRLHVVFAASADAAGAVFDPAFVTALRNQLAAIGISVTVVPLPQTASPAERAAVLARADLTRAAANADMTRDPVEYLRPLPYLPQPTGRARTDRGPPVSAPGNRRRGARGQARSSRHLRCGRQPGHARARLEAARLHDRPARIPRARSRGALPSEWRESASMIGIVPPPPIPTAHHCFSRAHARDRGGGSERVSPSPR